VRSLRPAACVTAGALAAALASAAANADPADRRTLAELELSSLLESNGGDGSTGFVLEGIAENDRSGSAVAGLGDINGDDIDDFIIGAHFADTEPGSGTEEGQAYVVFGRDVDQGAAFAPEIELASLLPEDGGDGSAGFALIGIDSVDQAGRSVSGAGDVNGDGIDDMLVAAPYASLPGRPYAGEAYVVFGRDSGQGEAFPAAFELRSLLPANGGNGSAGFVMRGTAVYDLAGGAVSAAGDLNGDGIDDLVVGARGADPNGRSYAGQSFVLFGRAGAFSAVVELSSLLPANGGDGSRGFVLNGIDPNDSSGYALAAAGDVNGDGLADLVVGARNADPGDSNAGESYVVFGRVGEAAFPAALELSSLLPANGGNGTAGFVMNGIDANDTSGGEVSAADINGDGLGDLIVGAPGADPDSLESAGEAYVVFGRDTTQTGPFAPVLELADLQPQNGGNGEAGFVIEGFQALADAGVVSDAGDVNGDGIADFIVGAFFADTDGRRDAGESYVVYGRDSSPGASFPASFELSDLFAVNGGDGSAGFVLKGIAANDISGYAVSAAGDVNGDGRDDLLIGAWRAEPDGRNDAGESYVVFGPDGDFDDDAIPDNDDNCQLLANADQRDTDADGFGNVCDPDLTQDGIVNFSDLGELKALFFSADADADFDGNGNVDFEDLGVMKSFFFLTPGPSGALQ
jgi:hypothetical protein